MPSRSWAGALIMAPITGPLQTPGMSTGETKVRWNVFYHFVPNFVLLILPRNHKNKGFSTYYPFWYKNLHCLNIRYQYHRLKREGGFN